MDAWLSAARTPPQRLPRTGTRTERARRIDTFRRQPATEALTAGLSPHATVYLFCDWNPSRNNQSKIPGIVSMEMPRTDPVNQYLPTAEMTRRSSSSSSKPGKRGLGFRSVGRLYVWKLYDNGNVNYTKAWGRVRRHQCDPCCNRTAGTGRNEGKVRTTRPTTARKAAGRTGAKTILER